MISLDNSDDGTAGGAASGTSKLNLSTIDTPANAIEGNISKQGNNNNINIIAYP